MSEMNEKSNDRTCVMNKKKCLPYTSGYEIVKSLAALLRKKRLLYTNHYKQ